MKAIPYILLLPLALIVLLTQCEKEHEPDPEPEVSIPDNNFLNALIESGVDTNGDGKISHAEAGMVRSLDVSEDSISDMTGIEKFVNLDTLDCSRNQLTSFDISSNIQLKELNCRKNQIIELDISNNIHLQKIICHQN